MVEEKWDEAIAELEKISAVGDYLISDYAALASIFLAKNEMGKFYHFLSQAYKLERDKETANALNSEAESISEER